MQFSKPLIEGTLLRRYKRFLADVELAGGERVTVHCPNTGSMMGCAEPGYRVWMSVSDNPKRKYRMTWEIVEDRGGTLVGINTVQSNGLVCEAISNGLIDELQGYKELRSEVRINNTMTRIDLVLDGNTKKPPCYVEVKNVTAVHDEGIALFPDAVTLRGTKHVNELIALSTAGNRAVMCFCVQRDDVSLVRPADEIDPTYGRILRQAIDLGVEAIAYRANVTLTGIELRDRIPVET